MNLNWWRRVMSEKPFACLMAAMILALIIRLYLFWQYYCINSDGVRYIQAAQDFYAGQINLGLSSVYPPLYPLMIAALFPVIGDWEVAGQMLSVAAGVVLLLPLFVLLRRIYGDPVALAACFIAAISPFLARYSAHVRTESAFILLATVALVLFYTGIRSQFRSRFFYGGLMAGLAYLVRPEGIGFLVIIPIALTIEGWLKKTFRLRGVVIGSVLTILGFLVFAAPYAVHLAVETGDWGAVSRKTNLAVWYGFKDTGLLDEGDLAAIRADDSPGVVEFAISHPFAYLKKIVLDLPMSLGVYLEAVYYAYVPFLFLGMFYAARRQFWKQADLLLFLYVGFYIVGFAALYVNLRYAVQLVPVSLGWVAMGMTWCISSPYIKNRLSPSSFSAAVTIVALIVVGATLGKTLRPISPEKAHVREAGRYLSQLNSDGALKVAALDNRIPFYAQAEALYLFNLGDNDLKTYIDKERPDFVAVEQKLWRRLFPEAAQRPEEFGLYLWKEFVGTRQDRLLVYKVG